MPGFRGVEVEKGDSGKIPQHCSSCRPSLREETEYLVKLCMINGSRRGPLVNNFVVSHGLRQCIKLASSL